MEIKFKNYKYKDNPLNFTIINSQINGLTGTELDKLVEIINIKKTYQGTIYIDEKRLTKDNTNNIKNLLATVPKEIEQLTYHLTVNQLLNYEISLRKLHLKNPTKKIIESLKIVGLDQQLLNREIYTLSSSEKKLLQLARALITNPKLLILIEPFKFLDMKNEKKLLILLNKIKDNYQKTILLVDTDTNKLYKYTTHLIIFKNNKILLEGDTLEILTKTNFLKTNKIPIPEIVEFTELANKNKHANIDYHRDIRDIIKDIYKHVSR